MRDPNRIPVMLEALRKEWEASPDQRLCQLISNITRGDGPISIVHRDLFNVEDTEFLRELGEYSRKHGANAPNKKDW